MHGLNSMVKQCYGQVYRWFFDWRLTETPSHSTEFHLLSAASLSAFPTLGQVHSTHTSMPISTFAFKHQLRNCPGLANPVVFCVLGISQPWQRGSHPSTRFHTLSTRVSQPWGCPLSCFLRGIPRKRQQKPLRSTRRSLNSPVWYL